MGKLDTGHRMPVILVKMPAATLSGHWLEGRGLKEECLQALAFRIGRAVTIYPIDLPPRRFRHVAGIAKTKQPGEEPVFGGQG